MYKNSNVAKAIQEACSQWRGKILKLQGRHDMQTFALPLRRLKVELAVAVCDNLVALTPEVVVDQLRLVGLKVDQLGGPIPLRPVGIFALHSFVGVQIVYKVDVVSPDASCRVVVLDAVEDLQQV